MFVELAYREVDYGAGKYVGFLNGKAGVYMVACYAGEDCGDRLPVAAPEWFAERGLPRVMARKLVDAAMSRPDL